MKTIVKDIIKVDSKGNETHYGVNVLEEVIPDGYIFNGLFYENKKSKIIYIVISN